MQHFLHLRLKSKSVQRSILRCKAYTYSSSITVKRPLEFSIYYTFIYHTVLLVQVVSKFWLRYLEFDLFFEPETIAVSLVDWQQGPFQICSLRIGFRQLFLNSFHVDVDFTNGLLVANEFCETWHECRVVLRLNNLFHAKVCRRIQSSLLLPFVLKFVKLERLSLTYLAITILNASFPPFSVILFNM